MTSPDFARPIGATYAYRTTQPLAWETKNRTIVVATGKVFDVSAPWGSRWAARLIAGDYWSALLYASAVHDEALRQSWAWQPAAVVFRDVMLDRGMPRWRAETLYRAVSWFGAYRRT